MLDRRVIHLIDDLRQQASERGVVLPDYTTNGDTTDLSSPLSDADWRPRRGNSSDQQIP